ncbi:Bacitracin export permease protein BceB [Clostridiales bacterium CHKCI001]|nr:Bacitracin export permease protein BceB [Clostridiales bacterium CHKCI001]
MLFKLSVKNFKKSIKDYSIYFFTLILGVAVFYMFNAIGTQAAMMEVSQTKEDIIATMNGVLSGISVLVALILGYLIVYASHFMMKKRKNEFGIYMTLGMSRWKISKILFWETLIIGVISLVIGLAVGIGLSQFMSLFVANLFEADMDQFIFVISWSAILRCILYFSVIYVGAIIFYLITIRKAKLIDLLTANKKQEKNRLKNPLVCFIVFLVAVGMLGYAYYNVTIGAEDLQTQGDVLIQILLGIVGTVLIFWSMAGMLVQVVKKIPHFYRRKLNSFVLGEISNKINTTVISGSIICLLLFLTICVLSAAFTLKGHKDGIMESLAPASISLYKDMRDGYSVLDVLEEQKIDKNSFKEVVDINTFEKETVTNASILEGIVDFGDTFNKARIPLIRISDYNKVAQIYHFSEYSLEENEFILLADYENMVIQWNEGLKKSPQIQIDGQLYHPKYFSCQTGFLTMSYSPMNMGVMIVPDSVIVQEKEWYCNYYIANYSDQKENDREWKDFIDSDAFDQQLNPNDAKWDPVYKGTRSNIYDDNIGTSAMYIFLGLYLGIVFMMAGAAILALKEMSDAADSKEKYALLRKLGVKEKEIHHALLQQHSIFFGFPLILSIVHSIFGIQVCNQMLGIYESEQILPSLITTSIVIILIYGGYFWIAHLGCNKMIEENK